MALSALHTSVKVEISSTFCEKKKKKKRKPLAFKFAGKKTPSYTHMHELKPNSQQDMKDLSSGNI